MDAETLHEALLTALDRADGNQSRFAKAIGTFQQNVSYWLKKRKPLPGEYVLPAERAGFGSRHELRPDLYPLEQSPVEEADKSATDPNAGRNGSDLTPSEPELPIGLLDEEPALPLGQAA